MKRESNYDNYGTNFMMFSFRMKESWVVTILKNTLWIHMAFKLVALHLTRYLYGRSKSKMHYKKSWFFKRFNLTKVSTLTKRIFTLTKGMGHERHMVLLTKMTILKKC